MNLSTAAEAGLVASPCVACDIEFVAADQVYWDTHERGGREGLHAHCYERDRRRDAALFNECATLASKHGSAMLAQAFREMAGMSLRKIKRASGADLHNVLSAKEVN